jgi:hypothetical protein
MIRADRARQAHDRLAHAMRDRTPACTNDPRFTADSITAADARPLKRICASCSLRIPCENYARLDRPTAGYWAGKRYGTNSPDELAA